MAALPDIFPDNLDDFPVNLGDFPDNLGDFPDNLANGVITTDRFSPSSKDGTKQTRTVTVPPSGVNFNALLRKFRTT